MFASTSTRASWLLRLVSGLCMVFVADLSRQPLSAQTERSQLNQAPQMTNGGGAVPVRIVDDRLVVACDVSGSQLRIPANLWLDFDGAYGFQLHNRAAFNLPAETQDGRPLPLTIHFPDFEIQVARRELGPEEDFEHFTKYHSAEIGENALVGAIGAEILKHFDVVFDLPRGQVMIVPPGGLAGVTESRTPNEVLVNITIQNDLVWLPVTLRGRQGELQKAMAIGSSHYDTLLDRRLCGQLGRPAGNVGPVRCGEIDFAPYVAFRPQDVILAHPDGVAGVMGLNLLKSFRVHVDRESRLATLQPPRSASFPAEELAFFQAMVSEDSVLVEDWLKQHSQTRLGREAAELLLTLMLDEGADEQQLAGGIQWINDTMPEDLRATRLLDLMEELVNEGELDLGIAAGELGIKSARADRYPEANYKLHGRLGELLLPKDNREAWRHLLSAAFGLPEDGMINLNLGRCYENNGQNRRAVSRYIQALIKAESSELAMEALARMDSRLPVSERLTIETIDRMTSGRIRNFTAPEKYVPQDPTQLANRTALVEFFTNSYFGTEERGGAIGGALGNQGLISHFLDHDCVFLSHHLPVPKLDPLVTPLGAHMAKWLRVPGPNVQVVDGRSVVAGAGKHRHAERIFKSARSAVVDRLAIPTDIGIEATGKLAPDGVSGHVRVTGPAVGLSGVSPTDRLLVQVVVAERGVVFHGSTGVVIHRMLARGLATPGSLRGVPYLPDEAGVFELNFSRTFAELEAANQAHYEQLEQGKTGGGSRIGMRIEPHSVEVIVVVREAATGEVRQAHRCQLERPESAE